MFYKTGYCYTSVDLFDNLYKRAKYKDRKKFAKLYKKDSFMELCASILTYCFYLIILDIIQNNITFAFPLIGKEAYLQVKQFDGETFKKMRQYGQFADIDVVMSNFKGYQIYYRYQYKEGFREKPIYINQNVKQLFTDKINEGKQYY